MSTSAHNINTDVFKDHWARSDIGARYKQIEKLTTPVAVALLEQSGALEASKRGDRIRLLDNACGTGSVSSLYHTGLSALKAEKTSDYRVTCADFSESMVAAARERAKAEGWKNTEIHVADAQDTKLPSGQYTHVLTSLGFGNFPNPDAALNEIRRELVPGGTMGITTWQSIGWSALLQHALEVLGSPLDALPDFLAKYKTMTGYNWASADVIHSLLAARGYTDITIRELHTRIKFSKEEIIHGETGKMALKTVIGLVPEQERMKWEDKVVPTLDKQWDRIFADTDGMSIIETVSIVTTAKKAL
ncbi:S-adenosyl-L-methionine-dependent methyltransferase [Auricularia subglabra TFB-10046 SS5]|nr:S-adenosyl-L-methionine-dependent methyltransferase [Auricularia subglabra TFB-10046 SS5]